MAKLQKQNSDGKRVHRPSDDPVAIAKILKLKTDLGELEQYDKNIKDSLSWYQVTESAVEDLGSAVDRMRDLAVQAANTGTNSPEDLKKIQAEIEELKRHIVSAGNFSYAGKYVFSGYQNDKPLFETKSVAGKDVVTYNVNISDRDAARPQKMTYMVGQAEQIQVSTNGIELFGLDKSGNVYSKMMTDSSGSAFEEGIAVIQGRFDEKLDYSADNLNITVGTTEYTVDVNGLDGSTNPVDKMLILERYKNATGGGGKLMDVANVYFDSHDNLVISAKIPGQALSSASTNIKLAESQMGLSAKKSELKGEFALDGANSDYRNQNLNVVIGGETYNVDSSELTGHGFELKKELVMEKFRNAKNAGGTSLYEVADIFFDQDNKLVIKDKSYGANTIAMEAASTGFNPVLTTGNDSSEASVSYPDFSFDDAYIAEHEEELKNNSLFITHNGVRKEISLDRNDVVDTVAGYQTSLQKAIDKHLGSGKVTVDATGGTLKFTSTNTADGIKPEISVEPVITKKSSLINDVDKFITALANYDQPAINKFLKDIDVHHDRILATRADLGAKTSRMELATERTKDNELSFTKALTGVENVDLAENIMILKNFENVYQASLATGTKIIQPSLVDFLR